MSLPGAAAAHGIGDRYDLPAPLAHFIAGAAATVALSFLVTALVARGRAGAPPAGAVAVPLGPLAPGLRAAGRALGLAVLGLVLWAGLAGDPHPMRNVVPTFVWIVWWVGLSLVAAFVGNLWPILDPWRTLFDVADALARRAGGRGLALGMAYPRGLGRWPAVGLLLAFAWCELVYPHASVPSRIAALALGWSALTWTGMAAFGRRTWQDRGDAFALYFAALGRFAPLAAGADGRSLTLRPLGRGLIEPDDSPPGTVAFVIGMLAIVLFDGLLGTAAWRRVESALASSIPVDPEAHGLATAGLLGVWLLLLLAYLAACRLSGPATAGGTASIAPRFALTLIPIAVAYHVAHNLGYLLLRGQELIPLLSDPLGRDWDLFGTAGWSPDLTLVGARFEWYVAVGAVVAGHVIAIWLAHRLMLHQVPAPRKAVAASLPLTVLMVGYTALSLWVIADPLVRFNAPDPPASRREDQSRTMRSISTAPPSASAVTPTVVRAGRRPGAKCLAYSAFTAG